MNKEKKELLEKLAKLEHEQWQHWYNYSMNKKNLTWKNVKRWIKQSKTKYEDLSEKDKEKDRKWARQVLKILKDGKHKKRKT